jgi:hypothetical protein
VHERKRSDLLHEAKVAGPPRLEMLMTQAGFDAGQWNLPRQPPSSLPDWMETSDSLRGFRQLRHFESIAMLVSKVRQQRALQYHSTLHAGGRALYVTAANLMM